MSPYTHFTLEERELSMVLIAQGFSLRAAARKLNRAPSTLCRELQRNSNKNGSYSAIAADKRYHKRRIICGRKTKAFLNDKVKEYVSEKLMLGWSPEQISGRAKLDNEPFLISYNTIYRAIEKGILPKQFRLLLRIKRIKNRKRKTNDKRGKIANTKSISERPMGANQRLEFGHWESDTVLGKRKTGCIGTHVERKSGFLIAFKLEHRRDNLFNEATIKAFSAIPDIFKKSFTVDNGSEFYSHEDLTAKTNMAVYFCDPYSPWQRGSNENTNCLLRQYFPKGSSFADISNERLAEVVNLINNRPRKRFGYKTPLEIFLKCCA